MIRLRNAVLALATGLLATGAYAQHFMQDMESATVAHELFGGDAVELEFKDFDADTASTMFEPKAKLIFGGSAMIATNTEFSVTYRLSNATFAESVSFQDFMWGSWGPRIVADDGATADVDESAGNCQLEFTALPVEVEVEREGGSKGSGEVTFNVKILGQADSGATPPNSALVAGTTSIPGLASPVKSTPTGKLTRADCTVASNQEAEGLVDGYVAGSTTRKIVFVLPNVDATGLRAAGANGATDPGASVVVTSVIEQTKSTGTSIMEGVHMGHHCGTLADGMPRVVARAPGTGGCPVVNAVKVITGITADVTGAGGLISLTPDDDRAVLVGGDGKALKVQRALLATVKVEANLASGARDQDGDPITSFTNDMAGSLAITVSSEGFRDGDEVYIDENSNGEIDGREAFEIDGETALDTILLASGNTAVYYVPNGKDALKHRTAFSTVASTEFADVDNRTVSSKAGAATLKLHGIRDGVAKAYAIAPITSTDIANVRVTCEATGKTGCNVFLDCKDAMGMNTFGEAGAMIGPGMTVRWNQMDVAAALGLEDGWEGRMSCDVLSSAPITVQVLTRANGVLVNNTAIATGGN